MTMEVLAPPAGVKLNQDSLKITIRDFPSDQLGLSDEICSSGIYKGICDKNSQETLARIKQGDDINVICKNTGNTLIHIIMVEASPISETKYVPMVYQLSNANANLDLVNKNGMTPLHLSIKMHLLELMVALIKCGATCKPEEDDELIVSCSGPVEYEFRSMYRKFSPGYWLPVEEDKAFKVNVLVKSWCRINIQKSDKSLIEFAKEKNAQEKIVKMLMDNEVTVEFAHATIAGDSERMKNLLQHYNVNVESKDLSHKENYFEPYCPLTLYGAAVKYGHKHILPMIKNSGELTSTQQQPSNTSENNWLDNNDPLRQNTSQSALCTIL